MTNKTQDANVPTPPVTEPRPVRTLQLQALEPRIAPNVVWGD